MENPLLIDPTLVDPSLHLEWRHDGPQSMVRAREVNGVKDARGVASIRGYALNRVTLIARRNSALKILRVNRTRILDRLAETLEMGVDLGRAVELALRDVSALRRSYDDDQEFTAMTRAFVAAFEDELSAMIAADDA